LHRRGRPVDDPPMNRTDPAFEWSHLLPDGRLVTNLTATREELLQVLRDVKADAAQRLAEAHHRTIHARRLWSQAQFEQRTRTRN
jgi:hypothetical protein